MIIINKLNVYNTWQEVNSTIVINTVTIVIDVFRASNSIITALSNGASTIIPVSEIDVAFEIKKNNPKFLLGGERKSLKIEGFNFGNSPLEYTKDKIQDKTIIFTTANGSRALNKVHLADKIFVASFANAKYIAEKVINYNKNISIVCAGTLGNTSLEDSLAAGKIIDEILKNTNYELNDFAYLCLGSYRNNKNDLFNLVSNSANGKRLYELNKIEDIKYCIQEDTISLIPLYENKKISLL
ncbi:2-phosphosulfolactate phosphatase [Desulfonispora thiosulfatigenes DSM 11270]|uniref:Probable 2-phosphosulfolactate phosphatase n=1 Tax=Desulfonispora thiosulfatigenes DSM 11270 TaxID=656914 RepID=A0A1W1VTV6_DESTI|nr:2-phosphosulfolactate phosphatase [Desulfonispora thiosulfatigenes]SMB96541.1 2-phosphosulfolactate phosphatase [Desulfonispora thiosulfatigenes DSM 11270]